MATAATVIPQIGSTASVGRGGRDGDLGVPGGRGALPAAPGDHGREDRQRDLGRGASADVDPGRHVDQLEVRLGDAVGAEVGEHAGAALVARHQADVRHAHLEAAPQRVELVPPVGGDDDGEVARARARVSPPSTATASSPRSRRERDDRGRDRCVADDQDTWCREHGLEEDLDRAPGEARVLRGHRPLLDGDLLPGAGVLADRPVRNDSQEQRLLGLDRLQRIRTHALLRAHPADEAFDRAVCQHEGDVAGLHARRTLCSDDRRGHERLALCGKLLRSPRQIGAHHCGGSGRPCIAAQTRAGVQGMSR